MNEPMRNNHKNRTLKPLARGWMKDSLFSGELHRYNDSRFSGHIRIRQPQNSKYKLCSVEIVLSDRKQRKFLPIVDYKVEVNNDVELQQAVEEAKKKAEEMMSSVSNIVESVDIEFEIPAPYNQYYEFSPNEVNYEELPDAFDHYKDLKVVAELYAKEQYEDALADNCLDFCWLVSDNGRLMLVTTAGLRVYPITLEEIQDCVGNNDYDDYEDLEEAAEMSDAQRLALQELDSALECGEVTQQEHDDGQNVQWDINFEDVVLFIAGIDIPLKDVKHVEYGECDPSKFDGCYSVTLHDGSIKKYGWHDFDMTGALTAIQDCDEGILNTVTGMSTPGSPLPEDLDDWEKRFSWANKYYKDTMIISAIPGYPDASKIAHWHLECTRPAKHIGNFRTLEAAKEAGDKELAAKNKANKRKKPQFGVHQFSTDSIIFRGTEKQCGRFINSREELWDDAEVYMIMPDDPHYRDLNEGTGSDTAHVIKDILTTASKDDSNSWTKTVADIIDIIPDEYIDDLYDIAKDKLSDIKVSDTDKQKLLDAAGEDVDGSENADTLGKLLALFDITTWDAKTLKSYILIVLGIVAIIEPTPIVDVITGIVSLLPADIVKTILSITNMIGNPVGAIGTIANRAYQNSKNEDYARVDAKDFVKHPMNYDVTSMLEFEVQDDVKVYIHRGPGRQREFYIIIGDAYVQHAFNKLETVEKYLRRNNLVKEVISESFKPGDVVYVTVCNRQGRVRKMISPDVVEVELHDNGVYPERIDRYYVDEVELQYSDDLDDEF